MSNTLFYSDVLTVLTKIAVAFALSFVIAWFYKKTHKGLSYSQSFVLTLIFLTILISVVMMVIGNSIAKAFTLLGAFTIIRFRTAIKDTRDIAFIFWALVTGMSVGTGNYTIATITTAMLIIIVLFLSKINFGSIRNYDHVLSFVIDAEKTKSDAYKPVFERYLKRETLLNINSRDGGKKIEFTFNITFVNDKEAAEFVTGLKSTFGVEEVNLLTAKEDIEY